MSQVRKCDSPRKDLRERHALKMHSCVASSASSLHRTRLAATARRSESEEAISKENALSSPSRAADRSEASSMSSRGFDVVVFILCSVTFVTLSVKLRGLRRQTLRSVQEAGRTRRGRLSRADTERRRDQLHEAATAVFLEFGYSRATMGGVAKKAGCSLETLYSLYPNKASMCSALIERRAGAMFDAVGDLNVNRDHHEALLKFSLELFPMMMRLESRELHRVVIAESPAFPDLGELFWHEGPGRAQEAVALFLEKKRQEGKILVRNCKRAAATFMALLIGDITQRTILGLDSGADSPKQQERLARRATKLFCRLLDAGFL